MWTRSRHRNAACDFYRVCFKVESQCCPLLTPVLCLKLNVIRQRPMDFLKHLLIVCLHTTPHTSRPIIAVWLPLWAEALGDLFQTTDQVDVIFPTCLTFFIFSSPLCFFISVRVFPACTMIACLAVLLGGACCWYAVLSVLAVDAICFSIHSTLVALTAEDAGWRLVYCCLWLSSISSPSSFSPIVVSFPLLLFSSASTLQWWKVTKYIYSNTV